MMPAPKFPQYKTLIFETWPIERCIGYARNPSSSGSPHVPQGGSSWSYLIMGMSVSYPSESDGLKIPKSRLAPPASANPPRAEEQARACAVVQVWCSRSHR